MVANWLNAILFWFGSHGLVAVVLHPEREWRQYSSSIYLGYITTISSRRDQTMRTGSGFARKKNGKQFHSERVYSFFKSVCACLSIHSSLTVNRCTLFWFFVLLCLCVALSVRLARHLHITIQREHIQRSATSDRAEWPSTRWSNTVCQLRVTVELCFVSARTRCDCQHQCGQSIGVAHRVAPVSSQWQATSTSSLEPCARSPSCVPAGTRQRTKIGSLKWTPSTKRYSLWLGLCQQCQQQ